ncbi:MAG: large repetitive protein, partial [Solirubrobacteraceae bacterium]|nr:large repetitive protein [Solirubrobacteraceae bacterium]
NPTFVDIGASPYEGQARPLCDTKLVALQNGKSVVPMFNVFTDVPLPGRFFGLNVDDLMFSTDPRSLLFGEKAGLAFSPVGIYDFANRLITTVETDYNGIFDVLLPSTNRINCPTPSGVCANLYRFVGNDPGVPGALNLNYNPQYRTIAAEFEAFPGLIIPADTAPTQVGVTVQLPGTQQNILLSCPVNDPDVSTANRVPELYAVSRPYTTGTSAGFEVYGKGFGATKGTGQLTLDGSDVTVASWTDTKITVTAGLSSSIGQGPHQLRVTAANGKTTVNGLTFHRIGGSYNPPVYEVGPTNNPNFTTAKATAGRWFTPAETLPATANHAIQNALNAAPAGALVVVYPNKPSADPRQNPRGAYYENLIISKRVKLQGVGPGSPDGSVRGAIIDGGAFGGDGPVEADWYNRLDALTWDGNQAVFDGAVISLFLPSSGGNAFPTSFNATTAPTIDGFDLRGGDQMGFPGNLSEITGFPSSEGGSLTTQGGAIFANAYARNLQITNNVVQNNGGAYGTIRLGTPDLDNPDNQNDAVRIMNNRILANGGTNLAGGIGIFAGADGYVVRANDICGNFSAEYGGGLTVYGLSPNGSIDHNRVYYNQSYDEGGGIMIAGQLPTDPSILSPGAGTTSIHDNVIQQNLANDDGGGLRFLMASSDCDSSNAIYRACPINVYNNMIVNNVSTHEGGGIAIDDTPNIRIDNNTIMKNVTTATAVTSDGQPVPAGLSTAANSALLQSKLNTIAGAAAFSNPLLFNNIFWDNRAGTRLAGTVVGIGGDGDATPINVWDLGVADASGQLAPTNSVIQQPNTPAKPYTTGPSNSSSDPAVVDPYDVELVFAPWRTNPNFVGAIVVGQDLPPKLLGDYHLTSASASVSAYNTGAASKAVPAYQQPPSTLAAPTSDIDGHPRPARGGFDIGADEIPPPFANLSITKTDGVTTVQPGGSLTYTIVVTNAGPSTVTAGPVTDTFPPSLTVNTWTCSAVAGSSCAATGSGNARTGTVTLLSGDSATFTATVTVSASATPGNLANTATVATSGITVDPDTSNNSATDTDAIVLPLPTLTVLDPFATNGTTLGANWIQQSGIAVSNQQARSGTSTLQALWIGAGNPFGAKQGAAFTFVQSGTSPSAPVNGSALLLKANGTTATPSSYIRVTYDSGSGGRIVVTWATSTNNGTIGTFATGTWAIGDTLTAVANANGTVDVWRNATFLGRTSAAAAFTGIGRIGIRLPNTSRIDNFSGQTLP